MRNKKFLRTCKGCFQKFDKQKLDRDIIQMGYDKENKKYIFNYLKSNLKEFEIQNVPIINMGKTLYICTNEKCINNALKKRIIGRFFGKELSKKEIEILENYKNKRI